MSRGIKRFTEEMFGLLQDSRSIKARLYNSKGQILIYPKDNATWPEMERLRNFIPSGVFFREEDESVLFSQVAAPQEPTPVVDIKPEAPCTPDGLSNIRLISHQAAQELSAETLALFSELKTTSLQSHQSKSLYNRFRKVFSSFESHPEAMNGLVNIIDLLGGMEMLPEPKQAIKRTVVAMALKTRGMRAQTNKDAQTFEQMVTDLMMSALLCDVGYLRMKPCTENCTPAEKLKHRDNHPVYSFILVAQDESLSSTVKFNILSHHRSLLDNSSRNNNYPDVLWLREKLKTFAQNYQQGDNAEKVRKEVETQLDLLAMGIHYNEDLAILDLASAFADYTTAKEGSASLSPVDAIHRIINESLFTYPERIVREFLDHIAMSLCDNQKIIREGDYIILASYGADKQLIWEVGRVISSNRWQSRPVVLCFATVKPSITQEGQLKISGFPVESIRPLYRPIRVMLEADFHRRMVYVFNGSEEPEQTRALNTIFYSLKVPREVLETASSAF